VRWPRIIAARDGSLKACEMTAAAAKKKPERLCCVKQASQVKCLLAAHHGSTRGVTEGLQQQQ
jgi:hypothetical protein